MIPVQEVSGVLSRGLFYSLLHPVLFRSAVVLDPVPESYYLPVQQLFLAVLLLPLVSLLLLLLSAAPQTAVSLRFSVLPVLQMSVRVLVR